MRLFASKTHRCGTKAVCLNKSENNKLERTATQSLKLFPRTEQIHPTNTKNTRKGRQKRTKTNYVNLIFSTKYLLFFLTSRNKIPHNHNSYICMQRLFHPIQNQECFFHASSTEHYADSLPPFPHCI